MKRIKCFYISPYVKECIDYLFLNGVGGMSVNDAKGFGKKIIRPENNLFFPKTKLEIYVTDK